MSDAVWVETRCCVCGEELQPGDEIVFRVSGPIPVGYMHQNRLRPLHEVCGIAHKQVERRRGQQDGHNDD